MSIKKLFAGVNYKRCLCKATTSVMTLNIIFVYSELLVKD